MFFPWHIKGHVHVNVNVIFLLDMCTAQNIYVSKFLYSLFIILLPPNVNNIHYKEYTGIVDLTQIGYKTTNLGCLLEIFDAPVSFSNVIVSEAPE